MRNGDLRANLDLRDLAHHPNLYALGPVEGLRGEITIWDSTPSISTVKPDGTATVAATFETRACFLVYAQVSAWVEQVLPDDVRDESQLEAFVARAATVAGLDPARPFPFAVIGTLPEVAYHIINKTDDAPHSREKHNGIKVHFTLKNRPVRILGFYSAKHHGIFTHHGTNIHLHVITDDGRESGHVESLRLSPGARLLLPR